MESIIEYEKCKCNLRTMQPNKNGPAVSASLNIGLAKTVVTVETESWNKFKIKFIFAVSYFHAFCNTNQ